MLKSPKRDGKLIEQAETDKVTQALVRSAFRGYTVAAVSHRLGSVSDFDRVIVIDGRVARRVEKVSLLRKLSQNLS